MMQCIVGLPRESIEVYNNFDHLCDELVLEILQRLPNCKSVIRCSCVSKRWASLASHPRFITNFILLKKDYTFAFVMQFEPNKFCPLKQGFESFFRPSIFNVQESTFSLLRDAIVSADGMRASCKDLLLCYKHDDSKYDYYISNVQTRECLVLPSLSDYYGKINLAGFICDIFSYCERDVVMNASYHFSVVVVHCKPRPLIKLSAHIFSSHCGGQWCIKVLALPKPCTVQPPGHSGGFCFCFDGKLHFSLFEGFFGFDHNRLGCDDEIQCHFIEWPVGMLSGNHRVDVSQEILYVTNFSRETGRLNVWALEDYKKGCWMLQHKVETHEWVSRDSWMKKKLKRYSCRRVLGIHPGCSDVIYVVIPGYIFLCSVSTKTVELACNIPVVEKNKKHSYFFYGLPIMFQRWPTPLTRLVHSLKDGANVTLASCSGLLRSLD